MHDYPLSDELTVMQMKIMCQAILRTFENILQKNKPINDNGEEISWFEY